MLIRALCLLAVFFPVGRDWQAMALMLAAVLSWSLFPLAFSLSGGVGAPLLTGGLWRLGVSLIGLCLLCFLFRPLVRDPSVWRLVGANLPRWSTVPMVLNGFQLALFFLASGSVDVSVVTVMSGLVPVIFILLMYGLAAGRYRRNLWSLSPFMVLAFLGSMLAVAGETGGLSLGSSGWSVVLGTSLSLLAALVGAFEAWTFRWGLDLAERGFQVYGTGYDPVLVALFGSLLVYVFLGLPGALATVLAGLVLGERLPWGVALSAVICGMFLQGFGNFLFRKANLVTGNLGVNLLGYLTPVFSLLALAVFGRVNVLSPVYLAVGVLTVVGSNLAAGLAGRRGTVGDS